MHIIFNKLTQPYLLTLKWFFRLKHKKAINRLLSFLGDHPGSSFLTSSCSHFFSDNPSHLNFTHTPVFVCLWFHRSSSEDWAGMAQSLSERCRNTYRLRVKTKATSWRLSEGDRFWNESNMWKAEGKIKDENSQENSCSHLSWYINIKQTLSYGFQFFFTHIHVIQKI